MPRTFQSSLPVAGDHYLQTVRPDEGRLLDVEIEGLDRPATSHAELKFTIDYPFPEPFHGRVRGAGGVTLRHILDAVRGGFRRMYSTGTANDLPGLANKLVEGAYGRAYHAIEDLVIESIEIDKAAQCLRLGIGS
jgi:hypothetical protein